MNANPTRKTVENDVIDIDLSITKKKKIRIDHDDNRIIELNTSDVNIVARITESNPKLRELQQIASKIAVEEEFKDDDTEISKYSSLAEKLREIDSKMREVIDYIFDSKISDIVAPDGSMYDLFNGQFRYEYIIEKLIGLYEANLKEEYAKLEKQMKLHTGKYIKK